MFDSIVEPLRPVDTTMTGRAALIPARQDTSPGQPRAEVAALPVAARSHPGRGPKKGTIVQVIGLAPERNRVMLRPAPGPPGDEHDPIEEISPEKHHVEAVVRRPPARA